MTLEDYNTAVIKNEKSAVEYVLLTNSFSVAFSKVDEQIENNFNSKPEEIISSYSNHCIKDYDKNTDTDWIKDIEMDYYIKEVEATSPTLKWSPHDE